LENTSVWENIGTPNQTEYGGIYFALENATGQYTGLDIVSLGVQSYPFQEGAVDLFYYDEFATGTAGLQAVNTADQSTNCGSYSVQGGYYSTVRCKVSPLIFRVQSSLSTGLPGLTVAFGSTITISGVGFGQQPCSTCGVSVYPNLSLTVSTWSDQTITAFLPSFSNAGAIGLTVQTAAGSDYMTLMVAPAVSPPTISLSTTQVRFAYTVGSASPSSQAITVSNSGGGTFTWSAASNVSWLTLSTATGLLTVSVNPASLSPNTYTGTITVTATGVTNSPQTVSVTLLVAAPALPPTIALSPAQLQFAYTAGTAAPAAKSVTISNSGTGTFTWSASSNVSWLNLSSAPGVLTVSVNPAGLSPNTYSGTITITATGASNSPQAVSVTLTVTAPAPTISLSTSQATFTYTVGSAASSAQSISISNAGGGTLAWSASSNSSWLSATPSGTAPSTLAISVNPSGLSANIYSGAIALTATGATNSPQTISVKLTVSAAATPAILVTSVTNGASGASGPIAPGEIVTIKGSGLGPATGVSFSLDAAGMVDTTLAGTQVFFGSYAAPVTYTSAGQINAIVPYEVAGQSAVVMQVQYQAAMSAGTTLQVASAEPGAFTFAGTGSGQAVAANQDYSFNGASNPAAPGSYVTIYFTGGGQTNPAGVTGSVTGDVLKWLVQSASVTVGGVPAVVAFDGSAPTFVDGVGQLNIQLATNTPSGPAQPLVIAVGGIPSPSTATLAVQ
jgi:uncharacterized protein (TIGR03437 family)